MAEGRTAAAQDTTALVLAAQAGDERALEDLTAGHLPLVYNVIGRALNGHADVDDLVQETMIQVVRGLGGVREPDRFRSWLVAIAYRQIQLHLRGRRGSNLRRWDTPPPDIPDPSGDFVDRTITELMLTGQRRELVEATRWLDDGDRRLLSLWWQEVAGELTRADLAAALGVRPPHAAVRLQRMRAQLESARAVVRALHATPRCAELTALVRPWDGVVDPLWRKRLSRHVRGCDRCGPHRRGLVAPEQLLHGIAALPVPIGALPAALHGAAGLPPAGPGLLAQLQHLLHTKAAAVAAVTALAGGGFAYAVYELPAAPGGEAVAAAPTTAGGATPVATAAGPAASAGVSGAAPAPAWDNIHHGFGDGANSGAMVLTNNTSYRNGGAGFVFADAAATVRSSVSIDDGSAVVMGPAVRASRNTWNGGDWSAGMFRSTDPATAQGPRRPDGSLPRTDFLATGNGMGASLSGS